MNGKNNTIGIKNKQLFNFKILQRIDSEFQQSIFPLVVLAFHVLASRERAQTKPPSGLFEKLQAFLKSPQPLRNLKQQLSVSKHFLSLNQITADAF